MPLRGHQNTQSMPKRASRLTHPIDLRFRRSHTTSCKPEKQLPCYECAQVERMMYSPCPKFNSKKKVLFVAVVPNKSLSATAEPSQQMCKLCMSRIPTALYMTVYIVASRSCCIRVLGAHLEESLVKARIRPHK